MEPSSSISFQTSEHNPPDWSAFPADFVARLQSPACGYVWREGSPLSEDFVKGYYTSAQRTAFDFHDDPATAKGLPMAMQRCVRQRGHSEVRQLPPAAREPGDRPGGHGAPPRSTTIACCSHGELPIRTAIAVPLPLRPSA